MPPGPPFAPDAAATDIGTTDMASTSPASAAAATGGLPVPATGPRLLSPRPSRLPDGGAPKAAQFAKAGMTSVPISSMVCMTDSWGTL